MFYRISGNENCQHGSLSYLGADGGNNEYFRCRECGAVIIKEGESDYRKERREMGREESSLIDRFLGR